MAVETTTYGTPQHVQGAGYPMDMAFLVDRLEALINAGRRVPFGRVLVDEQEILEIIDQMRVCQPHEVNQARRIIQEREHIISQAQAESDSIVTMARDRAGYLLSENGLLLEAKSHSERMLVDARNESETLRSEADNYTAETLTHLEQVLAKALAQVQAGLKELR